MSNREEYFAGTLEDAPNGEPYYADRPIPGVFNCGHEPRCKTRDEHGDRMNALIDQCAADWNRKYGKNTTKR